jgi:DNA invertase Pin-like site-specific DNA recombinase
MTKAVAYYRVSTDRQGKSGLGLEAQQSSVHSYAKINGIHLEQEFTEVESGKKNDRPVLQQALTYCRKHKAKLIIAKLDRLGRNLAFIAALMDSKVSFTAVDNPHANELMLHLLAAFAQHERKAISTRTKEALQAAKRRGVKLGQHGTNVLSKANKEDADRFAQKMTSILAELKSEGIFTIRGVRDELNRRKIATYRGDAQWHFSSVNNLLNRLKAGKIPVS